MIRVELHHLADHLRFVDGKDPDDIVGPDRHVGTAVQNGHRRKRDKLAQIGLRVASRNKSNQRVRRLSHGPGRFDDLGQHRVAADGITPCQRPPAREGRLACSFGRGRLHVENIAVPNGAGFGNRDQVRLPIAIKPEDRQPIIATNNQPPRQRQQASHRNAGAARRQFVDGRPPDPANNGNGRPERRNNNPIAIRQRDILRGAALGDKRVEIECRHMTVPHQLHIAQAARLLDATRQEYRIQRRRQAGQDTRARSRNIAHDQD